MFGITMPWTKRRQEREAHKRLREALRRKALEESREKERAELIAREKRLTRDYPNRGIPSLPVRHSTPAQHRRDDSTDLTMPLVASHTYAPSSAAHHRSEPSPCRSSDTTHSFSRSDSTDSSYGCSSSDSGGGGSD